MQKFIKGLQMGKQIRFFMDESDEMEFYKYITGLGGQLITQNLVEVDCDSLQENRQRKVFIRFQNSQVIAGESGRLDMLNSDVIEFVRCMKHENSLNYGRLWMSTREGNLKVKWFNEKYILLSKWIRNTSKISEHKDFYITSGAFNLYRSGVRMLATPCVEVHF